MTRSRLAAAALPVGLVAALALYELGWRWPLLAGLVAANALWFPIPRSAVSWAGRCAVAVMLVMALVQVAATAQFFLAPRSDFHVLAMLLVLLNLALLAAAPRPPLEKRPFLSVHDLWSLLPAVAFLLPFAATFHHVGGLIPGIAEVAGIQITDATSHFVMVADLTYYQHLGYGQGMAYYPQGFHIGAAFLEQALLGDPRALGWSGEALLYFAQYVIAMLFLGLALYLFTAGLLARLRSLAAIDGWSGLGVALALAPSLALYYFTPFFLRGFLNYAYVVATIALGCWFLVETEHSERNPLWNVTAFLLLSYGASASWPLLTPPLLATGAVLLAVRGRPWFRPPRRVVPALTGLAALALLLVPVYLQTRYGIGTVLGDLSLGASFGGSHAAMLGAGAVLVLLGALDRRLPGPSRVALTAVMLPLFALVAGIVALQEFQSGQIGYYAAKVALPVEMLSLCVGVALLWAYAERSTFGRPAAVALAAVPLLVTGFLLSIDSNPAADLRSVFRDYSGAGKPPMYEHDLALLTSLGRTGAIAHSNTTAVHARPDGSLYQHEQLPFWADVLSYDTSSAEDRAALACVGDLYQLLAFRDTGTAADQQLIVTQLRSCAGLARSHGRTFYVITDAGSAVRVRQLFGASATIVQ